MKGIRVWLMVCVAGAMVGVAYGNYVQGFEEGQFTPGTYVYGYSGVTGWGANPYWGVSGGGGYLINTALPTGGYPAAASGDRYINVNGNDVTSGYYYSLFNLWQTDAPMVATPKQTVSFDFYLDPNSPAGSTVLMYLRGNINTPYYGNNYWGYLKNVELDNVGGVWTYKYAGRGGGLTTGPVIGAGGWHHVDYKFDFSVQNGTNDGATMDLVLDGTTLASNAVVDYWGANIDPNTFASVSSGNPFRMTWYVTPGASMYIDNFAYVPEPTTLLILIGSIFLAGKKSRRVA